MADDFLQTTLGLPYPMSSARSCIGASSISDEDEASAVKIEEKQHDETDELTDMEK